jgi:hypothetical protein
MYAAHDLKLVGSSGTVCVHPTSISNRMFTLVIVLCSDERCAALCWSCWRPIEVDHAWGVPYHLKAPADAPARWNARRRSRDQPLERGTAACPGGFQCGIYEVCIRWPLTLSIPGTGSFAHFGMEDK